MPDQPERIPPELLVDVQSGCAEQGKTGENSQLFVKHKFCEKLKWPVYVECGWIY